jgi:hypothetical protein
MNIKVATKGVKEESLDITESDVGAKKNTSGESEQEY